MRLLSLLLVLWLLQPAGPTQIRILLRDEQDAGVVGATITLRLQDGQLLDLTTDAQGVAQSGDLPGEAVWVLRGQRANGGTLIAESFPAGVGFRLGLIANQRRDALLRLYDSTLVLDPDMIFSPNEPGEPTVAAPPQLAEPVLPQPDPCERVHQSAVIGGAADCPLPTAAQPAGDPHQPVLAPLAPTPAAPAPSAWPLWAIALAGLLLCVLALALGVLRRRTQA